MEFIKEKSDTQVVVGHDNGFLRVWKIPNEKTEEIEKVHEWQPLYLQITAIHAQEGKIVSGDARANLHFTQLDGGDVLKVRENDQHCAIQALKFNSNGDKLASGLDLGIIYIYDGDGKRLHRLRGHEGAIQDFLWHENGLISSAKEKFIRVWDLETSELIQTLNLPKPSGYKKKTLSEDHKNAKLWTSLAPSTSPGEFISSGISGDIMIWRSEKADSNSKPFEPQPKIFCDRQTDLCHQRTVFGLAVSDQILVSISMDRKLKVWDLNTRKPTFNLMTNGGWIYALDKSPVEPDLLAIGVGDGMMRRVDTSCSPRTINVTWQGIAEKITALSWHKESMKIAYGTEHGKVGVWDSEKDKVNNFNSYHEKRVYSIDFIGDRVASIDGKVLKVHDKDSSEIITLQNRPTALSSYGDMVAFGFDEGMVSIFDHDFKEKVTKELHQKYVTTVKFSEDGKMLASSCNAGNIFISLTPNLESHRKLAGHADRVAALSFSPDGEKLVSASVDYTCQVWKISNGLPLANFRGHDQVLYSIVWMKNAIYSGSEDGVVHTWTEADCQFKTPPEESKRLKKERRRKKQMQTRINIANGKGPSRKPDVAKKPEEKPCPPSPSKSTASIDSVEQKKEGNNKQKRVKEYKKFAPLFNLDSDRSNAFQHLGIEDLFMLKDKKDPLPSYLAVYDGTKEQIIDIVKKEIKEEIESNCSGDVLSETSLWLGTFQDVIANDKITDTTVALAASMGNAAWRYVTEKYVDQLQRNNSFYKASTFLLALGRVEDAIRALNNANQHREALVLARLRLDPDHKLIEESLRLMADRMFATGNRISGCKALITLGETVEVAKRLSKSQKFVCWIGAMELLLTEEEDQEEEINKIQENFLHNMITLDWVDKVEDFVKTKTKALKCVI